MYTGFNFVVSQNNLIYTKQGMHAYPLIYLHGWINFPYEMTSSDITYCPAHDAQGSAKQGHISEVESCLE